MTDEEVGLFEPMPFEKDVRNLRIRLITQLPSIRAGIMASSDLELAILHGRSLCNFHVAAEVAAGRVKTAQGTAPAIPCEQVFYSLGLPTIDSKSRAKRNRKLSGCGLARLEEFSRSAIDSTLGARLVNHKKHSSDGGHRITSACTRRAKTRARDARRWAWIDG